MRRTSVWAVGFVIAPAVFGCGDGPAKDEPENSVIVIVDNNATNNATPNNATPNNATPNNVTPNNSTPTNSTSNVSCAPIVQKLDGTGGCRLTLVSPGNCDDVDFGSGPVEFAYSTDGTFCEGPHRFFVAGHPETTWETNGILLELTSTGGDVVSLSENGSAYAMTRDIGGFVRIARADLTPVATTTGQYHWGVTGFYDVNNGGSTSGTRTFTILGE